MKTRITILCENLVGRLVGSGEHGFSAFIETHQGNHFFDRIHVIKENEKETKRFIGVPYKKRYLEFLGANFILNTDFMEVEKGIFLTGEVPRKTSFEKSDPRLFSDIDGKMTQDIFLDDQSLILDTEKGLVVILGCAHSGMINFIHHAIVKMGKGKFYAILGGTHLDFLTPEQLEESIKSLKKMEIEKIGVSHCTGMRAAFRLHQEFGDRFSYGGVGSVLEI